MSRVLTSTFSFRSKLDDIIASWGGKGYCHCNKCTNATDQKSYPGECPELNSQCVQMWPDYPNATVEKMCENVPCADCKSVCFDFQFLQQLLEHCIFKIC